mgnify:CR=1 FL=1
MLTLLAALVLAVPAEEPATQAAVDETNLVASQGSHDDLSSTEVGSPRQKISKLDEPENDGPIISTCSAVITCFNSVLYVSGTITDDDMTSMTVYIKFNGVEYEESCNPSGGFSKSIDWTNHAEDTIEVWAVDNFAYQSETWDDFIFGL